jgi:4-azaleucine resistance transporter AzlC
VSSRASITGLSGDSRAALTDTLPVGAGMIPLGVAFGILVTQAGLAWWWTPVISGLLFAGSLEFLLLSLMTAGAPLATIALTTLLVNSRHVFYCLTFPLHRVQGRLGRLYARFALIDEAYALTTAPDAQRYSSRRILTMQIAMHAYWVGGGIVGALLGSAVPRSLDGLDFALVGLFIVLAVDAYRTGRDLSGGLLAVLCAISAAVVAPGQMLLVGMSLFVAVLAVRLRLNPASPLTLAARA